MLVTCVFFKCFFINLLDRFIFLIPKVITENPLLPTLGETEVTKQDTLLDLVMNASPVVQGVLLLLIVMSVVTWGIVFTKWVQIRKAKSQTAQFSNIFWTSRNLTQISEASQRLSASPVAAVFSAGNRELTAIVRSGENSNDQQNEFGDVENIDRALKRAKAEEITKLENGTTFLATTASAAPFIGLFGTVWGILTAFWAIGQQKSSSLAVVGPYIAEALIATAVGLAAAIPAVIAYNYFVSKLKVLGKDLNDFAIDLEHRIEKEFF